jgi:hypothetical protein
LKPARLQLDFIAPPREQRWAGLLLLLLSLVIAGDLAYRYREARIALARAEAARGLLPDERRPARTIPKERLDEHMKSAQSVLHQLALPWPVLIDAFEGAATNDVAMLQLQPDARDHVLRVTAEARHEDAMLSYLRSLGSANGMSDVHLLNHQLRDDDPQRPILFTVQGSIGRAP